MESTIKNTIPKEEQQGWEDFEERLNTPMEGRLLSEQDKEELLKKADIGEKAGRKITVKPYIRL